MEPRPRKNKPRGYAARSVLEWREHELDQYCARDAQENNWPEAPRSCEPNSIGPAHITSSAESKNTREQPEQHCRGLRVLQLRPVFHPRPPRRPGSSTVDLIVLNSTNVHSGQYHTLRDGRSTVLFNSSLQVSAITPRRYRADVQIGASLELAASRLVASASSMCWCLHVRPMALRQRASRKQVWVNLGWFQ